MSVFLLTNRKFYYSFLQGLTFVFFLMACADEAEEVIQIKPTNKLQAEAGIDQSVLIANEVLLDGTASVDGNGESFTYLWALTTKPTGSTAQIVDATLPIAKLTPDISGVYTLLLTITQGSFKDTDEMHIVVTNTDNPDEVSTNFISEDIHDDIVLEDIFTDPLQPDYIVTNNIHVQAQLTIKPGVVIEFEQDKGLLIMLGGALNAEGTAEEPIVFTGTQKQTGFWKGLLFATNNPNNKLEHTIVEFGGSSEFQESPRSNISVPGDAISGSVLSISNTVSRQSGGYGLYIGGASHLETFKDVEFIQNASAIYASPRNISLIEPNTLFVGNGFNGVETGGRLQEGQAISWNPLEYGTYRLTSHLIVASDLTINAGVIMHIAKNILITVEAGALFQTKGTVDNNVRLEALSTAAENAWIGMVFKSGLENTMTHTIIKNAGASKLPGMTDATASIGVTPGGRLNLTNSTLEKSAGWGIVLESGSLYNASIQTSNTFVYTVYGSVKFPETLQSVAIAGEWLSYESFIKNHSINENFYNSETKTWFEGAESPWAMTPQSGFGLKVDELGNYIWTIAVRHPNTECFTWSSEYFTGQVTADGQNLNFVEKTWRTRYFNSCALGENNDMDIEPGQMLLPYTITQELHPSTGELYWVLSITTGHDTFQLYKK